MDNPRWWHIATSALGLVLAVLVLVSDVGPARQTGALVALGVFIAGWFALGVRSFDSSTAALALSGIVVVSTGVAVGFFPMMAIMQAVAYPLLWVLARSLRGAVLLNVALAFAVGIGFWVSTGDLAQAALTVALSLGFSLALGIWITSIAERSEERQRLLDELTATQDRLAAVSRDSGIASERERLAREIHDTIAQDLTGLVLLAQQARRDLGAGDPAAVDERLALIEENAAMALAETRALVDATAPVSLTTGGLREALDRLAERTTRETGIGVTVAGDASGLDRADEVVLLRCAQEGLANVRKHSGARNATLEVSVGPHGARLTVRDDGHGFDADVPWSGFGLGGMRDRLALVGGTLDVRSTDSGTELTATLPATVTP